MAAQKITIISVEKADYQGKEYRKITDADGKTWNLKEKFSAIWKDLKPGTVLNAEIGIYMTKPYIKECTIESVGTGNPLPEPEKPSESHPSEKYKADPAKLDTTMRDTALMQAVQYTSHNYTTTVAFSEIESSYDAFLAMLKGDKLARVESMKEVKDVSEPSKPASTTAVVAKVEADRMENRGTEESPGTDSNKNEQRKQERIAFVERLKEHNWSVGKAVFTLNKTTKYNIGSIDDIPDYDVAYKVLKDLEKWEK